MWHVGSTAEGGTPPRHVGDARESVAVPEGHPCCVRCLPRLRAAPLYRDDQQVTSLGVQVSLSLSLCLSVCLSLSLSLSGVSLLFAPPAQCRPPVESFDRLRASMWRSGTGCESGSTGCEPHRGRRSHVHKSHRLRVPMWSAVRQVTNLRVQLWVCVSPAAPPRWSSTTGYGLVHEWQPLQHICGSA